MLHDGNSDASNKPKLKISIVSNINQKDKLGKERKEYTHSLGATGNESTFSWV